MKNKLEEMKAKMAEMQAQMDELQNEMDEMEIEIEEEDDYMDIGDEIENGEFTFTRTELTNFVLDMHQQFMSRMEDNISDMSFDEDVCELSLDGNTISVIVDSSALASEIVMGMDDPDADELSDLIDTIYREVKE